MVHIIPDAPFNQQLLPTELAQQSGLHVPLHLYNLHLNPEGSHGKVDLIIVLKSSKMINMGLRQQYNRDLNHQNWEIKQHIVIYCV